MNRHLKPFRLWLPLVLAFSLHFSPVHGADAVKASEKPQSGKLTIDPGEMMKPWTGDLNGMIERRIIRVLTVYSKTFYFTD